MDNREKNIVKLVVVAAILALNLLGLSIASNFLAREDNEAVVIVSEGGNTDSQIQFAHFYEENSGCSQELFCEEDCLCEHDCQYCEEGNTNQLNLRFAFGGRRSARWRSVGGFHAVSVSIYAVGGIATLGDDGINTGIGFLSDDAPMGASAGQSMSPLNSGGDHHDDAPAGAGGGQPSPSSMLDDDILLANENFEEEMTENNDTFDDELEDEPFEDENEPNEPEGEQDENASSDDAPNDAEPNDNEQEPTENPSEASQQPNPQTSDDFNIFGLIASAVGLLLSSLILVVSIINKKAAKV
ncbi:MAG: hypothetical protein FWE44_06895 [Defluviitaleaceae bacterium]|nr:hypothetical protein [Defluviitaleaceae bacterium]